MTNQEIFDKVTLHLLTQNEKSIGVDGTCKYRQNDLKCAVGCLIEDEDYTEKMEGIGVVNLIQRFGCLEWMWPHKSLLVSLQLIHDGYCPTKWFSVLFSLSEEISLEWKFDHLKPLES